MWINVTLVAFYIRRSSSSSSSNNNARIPHRHTLFVRMHARMNSSNMGTIVHIFRALAHSYTGTLTCKRTKSINGWELDFIVLMFGVPHFMQNRKLKIHLLDMIHSFVWVCVCCVCECLWCSRFYGLWMFIRCCMLKLYSNFRIRELNEYVCMLHKNDYERRNTIWASKRIHVWKCRAKRLR